MKYYKNIDEDYLQSVSIGTGQIEVTQEEFENLLSIIRAKPMDIGRKIWRLSVNLTWELYELPPEPEPEPSDSDELTDAEALDILLGGAT